MRCSLLLSVILFARLAVANPITARQSRITLPFAKKINTTGLPYAIKQDEARIQAFKRGAHPVAVTKDAAPTVNVPATNEIMSYVTTVGVGTPPTSYDLIVDTGSSFTWVGGNTDNPYVVTSSSVDTGLEFWLIYGSGIAFTEMYHDTVTIGSIGLTSQGVGGSVAAAGFNNMDGILGLGPTDLTDYTLNGVASDFPTVVDTAWSEGLIPAHAVSLSFEPTDSAPVTNGEITFGSVDSSKYQGIVTFAALTTTSPASEYWGIDQSISYDGEPILSTTAGIVDSGTTLIYIATDAYDRYQAATGATLDQTTGLLTITEDQYNNLADLLFEINGAAFTLTPNAQIWPRALNSAINGDTGSIYLVVCDIGTPTGSGLDFINGQPFLERFYTIFDTGYPSVGIGYTSLTYANIN
ncbi:hypothetical protein NM688_g5601 [Phlebia brevispora]|uniref:Uncharacterized protein n=1 Tax=Phlebia brevispora TaxID=194682 RepID=A0ACC1SSN7_9APHY|nr:hypothetical protein NM688_g5601 [Phlebia brevispora]